jgi:hypothetical protein
MESQVNYSGANGIDAEGHFAPIELLNTRWRHSGNRHVYTVDAYSWDAQRSLWLIHYHKGKHWFTRTVANFKGLRNGVPRFTLVDTGSDAAHGGEPRQASQSG